MKHNKVILCGIASNLPRLITDEQGNFTKGILSVNVVRNERYTGDSDKQLRQDTIFVMTENENIVKQMNAIKPNDIVFLKGVLVTKATEKVAICPECQSEQIQEGMIVYVAPIYFEIQHQNLTKREAIDLLYAKREISNDINVIGNLCIDPIKIDALKKTPIAQYQIAVSRTYRLDEEKTDFPWVKVYGKYAKEDIKRLRTGSGVMIDGYLQARAVSRKCTCSVCDNDFMWTDYAMEIVPYEVEYLSNYVTDEELEITKMMLNQ